VDGLVREYRHLPPQEPVVGASPDSAGHQRVRIRVSRLVECGLAEGRLPHRSSRPIGAASDPGCPINRAPQTLRRIIHGAHHLA